MIKKTLLSLILATTAHPLANTQEPVSIQIEGTQIEKTINNSKITKINEIIQPEEEFALKLADINFFEDTDLELNTTLVDRIIRSYFMRPGRIKWVQFMDVGVTGKHKQIFKDLKWKHLETQHFNIFTYDNKLNEKFMPFLEETFDEYEKRTGQVFDNKLDIWLFHNRRDMGQDMRLPGIVPEGLGGIIFVAKSDKFRVISLWEGIESEWRHVYRHEIDHRFFIEKTINSGKIETHPPLWYIEGHAEHFSERWDAKKEMMLRDSWYNKFFIPLNILQFISHPFALYLEGNFILNAIAEKFGEEAIRRIDDNTENTYNFEKNLQKSIGLNLNGLESLLLKELSQKYNTKKGIEDEAISLGPGRVLAANEDYIVYGTYSRMHNKLLVGKVGFSKDAVAEIEWQEMDKDWIPGSDSLHYFSRGASIRRNLIAYVVQDNGQDAIRIKRIVFDSEKKGKICGENCKSSRIRVENIKTQKFNDIISIRNPVFLDDERLAFIGDKGDFLNVFVYDIQSGHAEQVTNDKNAYLQMDYSSKLGKLVVAREDELTDNPNRCDTNINLYFLDMNTSKLEKLPDTGGDEKDPSFSPDGKRILFTGDESGTYNLYVYDLEEDEIEKIGEARIGAFSGRWMDNETVVFNTTKMLMPQMRLKKIPSIKELKTLNLNGHIRQSKKEEKEMLENLITTDSSPKVVWNDETYIISTAVPTSKGLILEGNISNAPRESTKTVFFLDSKGVRSTKEERKSLEKLLKEDKELSTDLMFLRKHHTIGEPAVLGNGRYIAAIVNTRLDEIDERNSESNQNKGMVRILVYDRESRRRFWIDRSSESVHDELDMKLLKGDVLMLSRIDKGWFSATKEHTFYNLQKFAPERIFHDLLTQHPGIKEELSLSFITPDKRYIIAEKTISKDVEWSVLDKDFKELFAYDLIEKKTIKLEGEMLDEDLEKIGVSGNRIIYHDKETESYYIVDVEEGKIYDLKFPGVSEKEITNFTVNSKDELLLSCFDYYKKSTSLYAGKLDKNKIKQKVTLEERLSEIPGAAKFRTYNDIITFTIPHSSTGIAFFNNKITKSVKIEKFELNDAKNKAIFSDKTNIYIFDLEAKDIQVIKNTKGFDLDGNLLYYSALSGRNFDIFSLNLDTGETNVVKQTSLNEVHPLVTEIGVKNSIFFSKRYKTPERGRWPEELNPLEKTLKKEFSINIFDKLSGTGLIAWSGGSAVFLDGILVCQDQLNENYLILDTTFLIPSIVYADLVYGNSKKGLEVDAYNHYVWGDLNTGVSVAKKIPFSRYVALRLTGGYEFARSSLNIDYKGDAHLLKAGIGLGYDSSQYGFHGPRDGQKAFAIATIGLNMATGHIANVDLNTGVRNYLPLGDMFSIATRAEFGGSVGEMPSLYLMGGSMTLRGIPLNSEWGNIYALGSLELRADIVQVAGLIFKDPITPASVLTYFPEVELGLYFDTGDAWYWNPVFHPTRENKTFNWKYNTGIFLQIPTLFGMELQFSFPIYGNDTKENFNFWIGGRW